MKLPYMDESLKGAGIKRTYWPRGDADLVRRKLASEVKALRSKKGATYSRTDQRKIAAEQWQKVCETHAPIEAFCR